MTPPLPRSVIREPRFEQQVQAILASVRRMDEAFEYVDYRLATDPESGIRTSVLGSGLPL